MNSLTKNTSDQEQAIKNFLHNYLNKQKDGKTIHNILAEVGSYYDADRSYIFELDPKHTEFSNTYEWCREGISADMGDLQNITFDGLESWFEELEKKRRVCYIVCIKEF